MSDIKKQISILLKAFSLVGDMEHNNYKIKKKEDEIKRIYTVCGSCGFWMLPTCHREKRGMVGRNQPICNDFKLAGPMGGIIRYKENELQELKERGQKLEEKLGQ